MAVTINVNGLSLVHRGSEATATATLPDVCKTPAPPAAPVPTPYPNVARSASLSNGTRRVRVDGGNPAAVAGSELSVSTGDEAGTAGGIKSSTVKLEATWLTYSFNVRFEGRNVCRLTDKLLMNHGNTACLGGVVQQPVKARAPLAVQKQPQPQPTGPWRFHLQPKDAPGGEKLAVICDAAPVGQRCEVEVRLANAGLLLARFKGEVQAGGKALVLRGVQRVGPAPTLPSIEARLIPDLKKKPSKHLYQRNPRWLPPHFTLTFDDGSSHLLVIPPGQRGLATNPYCYPIELRVSSGGQQVYSSAQAPSAVDCTNLLAHDCAEWAECMYENHRERLAKFGIGTHFGAKSLKHEARKVTVTAKQLVEQDLDSASCIGYLLAATSRGHKAFGLESLWKLARQSYLVAHKKQGIRPLSGVGLVKGLVEKAKWTALYWGVIYEAMQGRDNEGMRRALAPERAPIVAERKRVTASRAYCGIPITEVLSEVNPEWSAQRAALEKLPYALLCLEGGDHTAIIAGGNFYDANQDAPEFSPRVFGSNRGSRIPTLFGWLDRETKGPKMLIAVPPGVWQGLRGK